ncbi:hypothetical protein JL722_7258 [Aureococcus anophagefferens]|nr:hypothetical protein JL722_7258 [Aureococcus anophagefferens]
MIGQSMHRLGRNVAPEGLSTKQAARTTDVTMLKKERSGRGIVNKGKDLDRPSIAEETKSHVADSFHVIKKHGYLEKLSRGAMAGYQRASCCRAPTSSTTRRTSARSLAAVDVRPVLLEVGSDARMKARTLAAAAARGRFVLRAESPKDRDAWLRAIAEVQVEAKRDSSATWADSDSLKIVAGGADGAKADALLAAARARGRADLESPRASEARASTFDGRHVSSLTAASVVPVRAAKESEIPNFKGSYLGRVGYAGKPSKVVAPGCDIGV